MPLEMCLLSNLHTGACEALHEHPFGMFLRRSFRVCLNTDRPQLSSFVLRELDRLLAFTSNEHTPMKTLKIALALLAMSLFSLAGGPYRESLNIAQFKCDEQLEWELDASNHEQGFGCGLGKMKKSGEGQTMMLQAVKKAAVNLDITFPDKLLKEFSKSEHYKKTQDTTKDFAEGSKKRFVSGSFEEKSKKCQFYILALEDKDNFAYVMITCNRAGESISLTTVKSILQSLEFITND